MPGSSAYARAQSRELVDEPRGEHRVEARRDRVVQHARGPAARARSAIDASPSGAALALSLQRGERRAGDVVAPRARAGCAARRSAAAAPRSRDRRARAPRAARASLRAAARASSRARTSRVGARQRGQPFGQRLEVQHRAAGERAATRPRARISAIARSASRTKRAAEYASVGSTMSIR